ncbi:ABC transporter substrate-binding protein [Frankia sp. EI5c]|uniref:ABC transporter substrate-binding protein n=1 Tax=Frankia sp. EI5c TaxID=683316 RepID=UPI000824380D|nr:ABC transporter substrate-binding protein [Frankia sp. EI5c]
MSAAVLAAAAVGCSPAATDTGSSTACAAAPGVTDDTVRLGLLLSDTGGAADQVIGARAGIDARIRAENDKGGVRGRQIVYQLRDDASNLDQNLVAAKALVEKDEVFALLSATSVATGSAEYLHAAGVPIAGLAMEEAWTTNDNMVSYLNRLPSTVVFDTMGQFARSRGVERAVIITSSTSVASQVGAGRIRKILQYAGIEVVANIDYSPGATTPATVGRQIAKSGADGMFAPITGDDFVDAYSGAMAAGAALKVGLGVSGYGHELLARRGTAMSGAYFYVAYLPFEAETAAQRTYLDALARYSPELDPPDAQAAIESYITTDLLLRGLDAAGPCPTRENLLSALRSIPDYDGAGLLPAPVDLTKGFGQAARCLTFVRVDQAGAGFDVQEPSVCGNPIPDQAG